MNAYSDFAALAVGLAVNLLLFGFLAATGVWIALRFVHTAAPRARYIVAVIAFLLAAVAPTVVTLGDALKPESSSEAVVETQRQNSSEIVAIYEQKIAPNVFSDAIASQPNLLDDFVSLVGNSSIGIIFFTVTGR